VDELAAKCENIQLHLERDFVTKLDFQENA